MIAQLASPPAAKPALRASINYMKEWNDRKPAERKKLMLAAGYQTNNYNQRAWVGLTPHIREDISAVLRKIQRAANASTPNLAAPAVGLNAQESASRTKSEPWYKGGQYE